MAGFWSLFSGIGFYRNAPYYDREDADDLKIIAIIFGSVYMLLTAIEAFGFFAGITQKLLFARIFAWLSAGATLVVAALGLARTVIHFTKKSSILKVCVEAADGATWVYTGFWGPIASGRLDLEDAQRWCNRSWDRGSWSEIIAFIATTLLAALFTSIAFAYYRQLLDPTGPHNFSRAPASAIRTEIYPTHYAPPYPGGPAPYPTYGQPTPSHAPYSAYPAYGPPPGPPPAETKPPGYEGYGWTGNNDDNKTRNPFDDTAAPPAGGSNPRP